jgi:hypothetical protein
VFYKNTITQSGWDSAPWGILWDSDGDQQVNFYTEKNVPDVENLHRYNLLGNSIRPYPQSWFGNLYEARRTFIKRLNELMSHVDINTITNWENSILMKPSYLVGDHEIDMTAFWKIGDFISEDYKPTKLIGKTIDNISNLYNENYAIGEYIRINNINNPKQYDIYEKTLAGGFNAVFRKNSAIQFIEEFNLYGFDAEAWDTDSIPWDYDINSVFNGIVDAARDEIFIGKNSKYYSSIMCSMFRYVLSEQINVDWLAKSSTVEPVNLISQTLSNKDYVKRDEIGAITDFYSTVKAYRDKLRGGTVNKIAVDTLNISIYEHINITDISNADNVAVGSSAGVIIPINISTDNVAVGGLTGFTIPMNISIT